MIAKSGSAPFWFFDPAFAAEGWRFRNQYTSAEPFPHIVFDDFLDGALADQCLSEFPTSARPAAVYGRNQENKKVEFKPEFLSPSMRALFYSFNSLPFIGFLENLTGIEGLIPDPHFAGAGFHEVASGGHLNIHADFNLHEGLRLERRINVLIYLNRDWKEEYGGCFEIWDQTMRERCLRVVPQFNRCVIFNTSSTSFHGNPEPVNHPDGRSRRAIALYYYTSTWDGSRRAHMTQFKVRPGSRDAFDTAVWVDETAIDLLPPIVVRNLRRLRRVIQRRRQAPTAS